MKVFLIQGKSNVGKTTLCNAIEKWIIEKGKLKENRIKVGSGNDENDFISKYEINGKVVVINSWSDDEESIENLREVYEGDTGNCDVLITAIRPFYRNDKDIHTKLKDIFMNDVSEEDIIVIDMDNQEEYYNVLARIIMTGKFMDKFNEIINKK